MSTSEILEELPRLSPSDRRAIARRVFELEQDRDELDWATHAADLGFQELDKLEDEDASASSR